MPRHPRKVLALALAAAVLATLPPGGDAAQASPPGSIPTSAPPSGASAGDGDTVTLITGDVVTVASAGRGRYAASVDPGPGRDRVTFQTFEVDGDLRVIPADAVPYLSSGRLDPDLFAVSRLLEDGYGDEDRADLPLIVEYGEGPRTALRDPGVTRTHALASVDGGALSVRHDRLDDLWKTIATDAPGVAAAFDGGVARVWLDGRVHAVLDQSTGQIGAPTAWDRGLDGTGVDVAVLDTGVDLDHPDLAAQIALTQDFTGSGSVQDGFGHGTHVAGIVLGTGAASDGSRRGVASGARLFAGKVLDDWGFGQESWVIEGMEWAADNGADVVNMSLGGGTGSDGTDPLSEALDQLSKDTGTLFVVAAGNEGMDESIGSPGVASEALTVGAVDRDGSLAPFSSRGPRSGDLAVKPEITAPGVGIVAPRAFHTWLGEPVDDHYTRASGTSMATPHVAGAAAILAQQHPSWTGRQIKSALVSSAVRNPDLHPFQQGNGMVRVDRAISEPVFGAGVVDLGMFIEGTDTEPVVVETDYVNTSEEDITLDLALDVTNLQTGGSENDAVSLQRDSVFLPAGTKATVRIDVDPAELGRGRNAGYLTATGPDGLKISTALGAGVQPPTYQVTFKGVGIDGGMSGVPSLTLFGSGTTPDQISFIHYQVGSVTLDVQADTYIMTALMEHGAPLDEQVTYLVDPELEVQGDMTVVLDARDGNPIQVETPKPAEQQGILSYYAHRVMPGGRQVDQGVMHFSTVQQINVSPTRPLDGGEFEFASRWQLVAPMVAAAVDGVHGDWDINLLHTSPTFPGTKRLPLAYGGTGTPAELDDLAGKAVVVESDPEVSESQQIEAAADAGVAALLIVRPADFSAWTVWRPVGDRLPIPAMVVAHDDGQELLAKARSGVSKLSLALETSSPYLYDVLTVNDGVVPDRIVHEVTSADSARLKVDYGHMGGFPWEKEQRFGWRPWQHYAWNDTQRFVQTRKVRSEWVSAGDSLWQHRVDHEYFWDDMSPVATGLVGPVQKYAAGTGAESWFTPVVRPAAPGTPGAPVSTRTATALSFDIPAFVDAGHHWGSLRWGWPGETAHLAVRRDGVLLGQADSGRLDLPTTPTGAAYRVRLTTTRSDEEWTSATRTSTEWRFSSRAPAGTGAEALPMLQVDYRVGQVRTGGTGKPEVRLGLDFRDQRTRAARVDTVVVKMSRDHGTTWARVPATRLSGSGWKALLPVGKARAVSLKLVATARDGRQVRQTVVDAVRLR
ncbi:S8 family serine peptidase [Nocardioides sp. MAHUQ-72]|uniref:S8 family serine peptidase n=1 Tax=unclassified Nocardioides TaxID=2615069 RepID=UPI0036098196